MNELVTIIILLQQCLFYYFNLTFVKGISLKLLIKDYTCESKYGLESYTLYFNMIFYCSYF